MQVITSRDEIARLQMVFEDYWARISTQRINTVIGYQGGSLPAQVLWSDSLGMWSYSRRLDADNKYWNAFGFQDPNHNNNLSISCEINIPIDGLNRRIAGAFIKDESDNIYIIHRGNIGGGKKGVGKTSFFNNFTGNTINFKDDPITSTAALVGCLQSNDLDVRLKEFVMEVRRIKDIAK